MTDHPNDRRDFVKTAALAAAVLAVKDAGFPAIAKGASPMILPPLPWADNALEPFISKNTIGFHYGKHHKTYFDNLTGMVAGKPEADMDLVSIVKSSAGKADKAAMFNNSAQVWNHTFYWNSLRPKAVPVKRVVPDLGGIVEHRRLVGLAGRRLDDRDEIHVGFGLSGHHAGEVVEVRLVMLAVMEAARVLRDEGLERVVGPGKRGKNHGRRSFRDRGKARVFHS